MSWALRYKPGDGKHQQFLGRFMDKISIDPADSIAMKQEEETIKNDYVYLTKNDRFKPSNTTSYKANSNLIIDNKSSSVKYVGKLVNLNVSAEEGAVTFMKNEREMKDNNKSSTEAPFKYVILQRVAKGTADATTGKITTQEELNIIPIYDWYNFSKASYIPEKFLHEIGQDYIDKAERDRIRLSKYRHISRHLNHKVDENGKFINTQNAESAGSFVLPPLFGPTSNVITSKCSDTVNVHGNDDISGDKARMIVNDDAPISIEDAWGGDECLIKFSEGDGDINIRFADNDDDIAEEQNMLDHMESRREEEDVKHVDIQTMFDDEDEEEVDEEDVDEQAEAEEKMMEEYAKDKNAKSSNLESVEFKNSILEVRQHLLNTNDERINPSNSSVSSNTTSKRGRVDNQSSASATNTQNNASKAKKIKIEATNSSSSNVAYELTEGDIRKFIGLRDGRISLTELFTQFKPQIKGYGVAQGDKKAGSKLFTTIINEVTIVSEDELYGKLLVLK